MKVYPYFLKPATSLCRLSVFHSILWSRVALLFVVVSSVSLTFVSHAYAAPSPVPPLNTFTFYQNPGTYNYVIPPGVTSITVEVWGGGGRGGSRTTGTAGTGGGGGGAYSRRTVAVTPGQIYVVNVGVGSTSNTTPGGDTWVSPNTVGNALVLAKGGNSAANNVTTGATGGAAGSGIGDVRFSGGNGANAPSTTSSGGGGSSAGISANGTNASGTTGGVAPLNGGNGANGRTTAGSGTAGSLPGGGGSGAVRGTTGSPAGGAGAHGKVLINLTFDVNAGPDQTQCNNAMFQVSTNPPLAGYSFSWSVVSGTGFIYDNWSTNTQITVPAGSSATVRLSVTDGATTITDDVVLTNTTSCTPSCVNPVNINGDLEQQGTANAYNLSFQGTPASVIFQNSNPVGWAERYGTATPNTTSFTGAYYLNKTGVNGDPYSGSKFIYMAGEGICLSNLKTWQNISCGKTYRVSVWVAAYSNSGTQSSSPFAIEFNGGGPNVPSFAIAETLRAPASASWNNLNWQRYSFEFTIPSTGYEWGDFLFTTYDNVNGIVIDDMCVEEVFNGAFADAGPDQYKCDNSFTMAANTPASGYTGSWSVVSGSASVSNVSSPTSPVTLTSGNAARLRWTMTKSGTNTFYAINPEKEGGFESCCSPYDNGWTAVNNGTNNWVVGEGGGSTGGSQAAYISNNGGTSAAYNITTAQTSHLYRDVMVHPNATNINLQFDWQNLGESGFDRLLVYTAPTTLDPAAGTPASSSTTLTGATLVSTLNLHSRQHFTNELISLPASLAGTTFRLIFAWQNNNTGGTNWLPVVIDNVSLSYNLTTCNDFDEVTIVNNTANSGLTVNNANICPGTSATLTATGCNAGNLLWSNGATSNSITVFPATTSTYSVTCTPVPSANLLTNGNFESATNLQGWTNWDNASITTNPADVYAGSKAVFLNGSVSYAGVAQGFATTPGQRFRVRFYAKTTNSNALPLVRYHVYDNISNILDDGEGVHITSTNYQLYEFFVITPPNTTYLTIFAETSDKGGLYVDDFEVVSINGCTSTALSTVTVGETNVVQNPEFNSGTTSWELYSQGGAAATLNHDNTSQLSGVNSARINISTATGTDWHVQFVENGISLEAGKTYTLSFRARAAAARVINASVDLGQDPWTNFLYQNVNVTTTGQLFIYTFTQPSTTTNGRVVFNLGQSNQTVWIDDVKLFEACSSLCDPNNSNAPPFCAPSPICNSSNTINWSQSINSTNGNPGLVRFVACGGTVTYTLPISLPAEFNGPVSVNITDAVSWDGYSGRNTVSQSNESWRVLFRKNGSTVYASPFTNDVPDNVNQGYWRGSLGSATFLPNGADQIIIEHWGVSNNNTACNSVIPASVCISYAVCTPPAPPTTTSASRCGPGTVTLTAAGCSGGTVRWYPSATGGTSIGSGTSFTTPSISTTTSYFASCDAGGCESTTRTAAVATVNNVNAFVSGILNLCPSNNTTTLTGNGGGTYVWSTGSTSSSITVSPVSTTTYTLTVTNGGCSTAVTATVNVGLSCCAGHVTSNIIAEYNFSEGTGSVVNDVSGFGTPLNLTIQNPANTTWVTGCGLRINSSTRIASTGNATKIRTALQATNAMTVEAWVQAANTTQNGPARIVSMSTNTSERNFTLGQGTSGSPGTVWAFRTRQSGTNDWNGFPERTTTANSATTNLTHLVFTRDAAGVERFYINGVQNGTWTQTGNFSNWSDYVLNLGNEQTNDRPWLGTLYNVIIYSNALSAAEVTQNFSAGSKGDCSNCPPPDCITQLCAPLSCPSGSCYTNNLIVNPDFETNVNNWIASNGQVSQGGGGRYGNFIQVNVSDLAGTYTAYQDVNFGAGQGYRFEGNVAKHGVNNNVKVYLEFYNGSTYLSKTADFNVTMNFDGWNWENFGFQGVTPANTTKIRIVAWCNGNAIKMDKVSLIGCTSITSTANANNVCVGVTINLTSAINLNNANPVRQLVSNGGFVSGSVTGFSTDVPSGSFGFTTNPQNANGSWVWGSDNTTGTGNLMWFSDDNAASNRRQWFNTYTVVPNTTYTLSFWVRNVWSGGSNPTLFWTVNGTQVGSTITPAFGSNWVQLSTTWNSGSNTSATFAVVLQTNSWNFDFALDDISITGTETTYLWSGPNSYSSSLQNNNLTNAISSMAGTYSVITSAGNGCTASSNVNVVVNSNNTVTTNATRTLCVHTALSPTITHTTTGATGIGTPTGLPAGVTASWASNTITISGTPTASGTFNYTIPLTGGCGAVNATGTITVTANNSATTYATRTLCVNTALSPTITHTTTGATGIGTATGLPAGVTATWASNIITISGTPTASGTFNYTIPLTGGCGVVNATGTITVTANNTATTNATRTLCVNTALSPTITHTTTGATGIGTATGLPVGVTAAWASNTITISGTPTASGTFNYTIPLTGGCGAINATGTITVTANNTVTGIGSATTCINTAITTITHTTTGATGIGTATGLPAGVTASWASNTITISGTPTASGTFNYTIPLTGGCGAINATGTITVTPNNTVTGIGSATTCVNTAITTITHTTTGATGIGTATGLPAGVTAAWASNTITISGTPTASGTFNYTIPLTGGCGAVNATGTITVTANNTATTNATRTLCVNTALSPTITHTTTGATGIGTATGLPAGVIATWASNTITISGTPTASGTFNYTIPLTGGCGAINATGTITVTANNTVTGVGSATTCINTAITNITHTTTGATGIGTATGLPTGVTAVWASNTITISGTPTASGTFNYTIPLTGGCGVVNATGTITVTANNTVTTNAARTLCVNTALSPTITHTTTGATGIGTATGLPAGVTAAWASNTITISGTPTASGTFNYTIPLTGGCGVVNTTGTITVTANNTATTNSTRTLCVNTALSPTITHTTTGATGIGTATGLPAGVTATWASNTITISGTPTASGTFNYTIPLTGGCGAVNATGTITVTANNTVTGIGSATTCINTAITNITHTTTGATGIGTATGLPAGVTAAWASNTITISGTPTASGTFNYTIPLTGGCGAVNAIGTITVNANPTAPIVGTITQPTCITPTGSVVLSGLPSTGSWTISRTPGGTTYNGTGTSFTVTGLPVNTTFTFTVTNSNTCTSPASANVAINPIPSNPTLGGASAVCIGSTANVTPATAGTWTSSNNAVASITNAGLVTGVTAGSVTLTYTRTSDGCSNTRPFTVNTNPTAPVVGTIIQPTCITPAGSVVLNGLPSTGSWTITRTPGGVTYSGTGTSYTVNNLPSDNSYTFTVTNNNSCVSLSSASVGIDGIPSIPTLGGDDVVCVGATAIVNPTTSGTWLSSNTSVATITNEGVVTGIAPGMVVLTYTRNSNGCSGTREFTVYANPTAPVVGAITQPTCTTPTGSVVLSGLPATGNWTITRTPGGITYTGTGANFTVTGLPVNTTYNFTITNQNNCTSLSSADVSINQVPGSPVINGASAVCTGSSANITPASGGTWTSSNTSVATITNAGVVTGVTAGSVTLTYTRTSDGCSNTRPFTVNANPSAPVVGTITQPTCTTPTGSVVLSSLPATGSWTITRTPGGTTYTGTGTSFTVTGLPVSTTYTFTVTNSNLCTSPASANVAINIIPGAPVLGGASAVCVGSTANVTPSTAGTWTSSNNTVATITNAGLVTGVAAGSVTLTYTRTSDGCSNTRPFTVNPLPESSPCLEFPTGGRAPCFGAAEICDGGSIILKGKGYGTPPLTFMWNNGIGAGADHTVTLSSDGLPTKTYTFILTVTDGNGCSDEEYVTVYVHSKPDIDIAGSDNICVGNTSSVTPVTGGTWSSSNSTIATVTNAGLVNGIAPGTVNLTYTRTSDGCANSVPFTVNANPTAPIVGTISQPNCAVPTGSVILNGLPATGNYTINQSPGGISYNATGSSFTINGLSPNTNYAFTVTTAQNCTSPATTSVNISGSPSSPSVSIDYNGSVCLEDNKELSAIVTGGIAPFTYLWNGPSGFTASTQTVVISTNGNYYLTVTDANLCKAITSGFVYERYEPFVVSLQTRVCEGQNVTLDVNSPSAVSYLWGSNAGNSTTKMVTVTPQVPSSTYLVTVTNDLGCTAVPEITIEVDPRPIVSITGSNIICQEQTTQLSPSTGGTWVSTNPGVATINNSGLVTGVSAGTATFVFTSSTTNCASHPSAPVTVHAKPVVAVTGPNPICIGQTTTLSPSTGGTWTSSNVSVATVNNSGIVTGISTGSATFTYTNTSTSCVSNASTAVNVQNLPSATITGNGSVCESSNIILNASVPGGTWTSSNHAVAIVNNSGIVSGITPGTVTITYQYGTGVCSGQVQKNIEVLDKPVISYTGDQTICVGQTTTLSSGQSGNWTSSNPMIATISQSGVVTGVSGGMATFTFENLATGCLSDASEVLTVYEKPTVSLTGPSTICLGSTTQVTPSSGGVWTSSNPLVATITNNGVITSTGIGTTSFTFTDNLTGCSSDGNISVSVGAALSAAMDYHGSICLTDTSKLSVIPSGGTPAFSYQWVGPLGFTGNTQTIDINTNGNYFVTITDALGCKANLSGFVYQRFDPFIVNLSSSVCEGQSVNLSVNAPTAVAYLWSPNASNAVTSSVQVIPVLPSSAYFVTVTNNLGCKAVANASVLVNPKPVVNITGGNTICIGQTTTMTPSSGGSWVALHPSVATISQTGIVTGTGFGNARFLFTNTTTGCTSDTSGIVSVNSSTNIAFVGPSSVCAGDQTSVSPGSGGSWVSSNTSVATVNNAGLVVALSPGVAQLTYTNNLGCTTNGSLSVTVHDKPAILLDGPSQVCVGGTTRFLPSNGGTWTTSHASIASINNSGLVTGISQGTARFVYTNAFTGCKSDSSTTITILPRPVVQITGNNPICVGSTTTLFPNTGGMWMSSNPSVASVTNAGVVNGLGQGSVTFTFTNNTTGCTSLPTAPLTVNARPVVSVTGPNGICIGGTTTLSPSTGGTWTVVNPSVASVSNAGLVTGLAPGASGFIFTNSTTGCISNATNNVTVYGRPTVNINSTSICVGATTTVTPSTGGVWTSSNPAVATVNGSGLVTGVSAGQVTFTFTENTTGCTSNPTSTLQVFGKPVVSITGPTNICVGQTTTLQPITGGAWSSLSPSVATVSNSGIVTGVGNGSAQFVFTSNQGCASDPSGNVTVNARPVVIITGLNPICIGTTTQLSPASGGTWVSSHPSVASVNNSGLVTGLAAGGSRFVFTQTSTGCSSDSSSLITVNAPPVVNLLGSPSICIGQTSQVSPTAGGTWMSLNPTIATVSNVGLVTGVSAGQASFKFVQSSTGCENTLSNVITVRPRPDISLSGPSQICIGATTQFSPGSGGSWTSLMPSVATINVSGMVTGISQGQATFRFTSAATGCTSLASAPVTVLGRPTVLLDGPNSICIGNNTQVLPNSGGSWSSTNPLVATVSLTGLVTGVGAGTAQFVFTEENTGCVSNPTTAITVFNGATVSLSGPSSICTGYNTTLSSSTSGVWYSTNPMIAKVSSNGMVTGIAPGKVSFYFQQSGTGCLSYLPDDILTVTQCIDADFNVTAVNVTLTGDVHTNDEVPVGTTYSTNPYLIGKPDGSLATLTMLNNGKYTFTANTPGEYIYNVPVCIPGMGSSCPVSTLVITVVNPFSPNHNIITNLDITYTIQNIPVNFNAQVNDDCISASGCMVDPQMITVIVPPNHGNAIILTDGSLLYTPASGFIGFDTLTYQVCATNNAGNCRSAQLIVTVMSSDASNSLAAADDFYSIPKGGVVSDANVLFNDFDPEGGKISIIPQGSVQNPVVSVAGSYYINSEGVLHFEASPTFTGPFDIVYTICDSVNFCVNATAHILVVDNMKLRIRAYLEGALMENKDAVSSTGRPLMRDDLRNNKFTNSNIIPSIDPYSNPVGFIDISHRFDHVGSSGSAALTTIQHPNTVFAVTGENAIVDWVFIELRSKENYGEVIGTRSALIQRDGDVVDLDGVSFVEFPGLNVDSCYVVLKHRNHLGVMSLKIATGDLVDFTSPSTPVFDYGTGKNDGYDYTGLAQKADVALGYMSLWAGDFDGSGKIKFVNPDDDQNFLFIEVLFYPTNTDFVANYNFVHGYLQGDYDLNGKSKYDNPDDDKNMLFYQVLFYPLNTNYTSNFNFITEQVPPKNIN